VKDDATTLREVATKYQFWLLLFLSAWFLWGAPEVWYFTPDSGVYVGTAQTLAETGRYRFNGYPNLLYYPGFSGLLSVPIFFLGMDFQVLHLLCAGVGVLGLWLARAYFSSDRYGWPGLLLPFLLAASDLNRFQVFTILSDGTFLTATLAALLLWRVHEERASRGALLACIAMTAYASLVRFQGIFLCVAFGGALVLRALEQRPWRWQRLVPAAAASLAVALPFAFWTWRNFVQHTPDTFNMANRIFFGLQGLTLYGPGYMRVDWIQSEWMYGVHNLKLMLMELANSVLGRQITSSIPAQMAVTLLVVAILAGGVGWFRRASRMERIYVPVSLAYLLWNSLSSRNLYVVQRYWLPTLPFLLIAAGLALASVHHRLRGTRFQAAFGSVLVLLVTAILAQGFRNGLPGPGGGYWIRTHRVIAALADFVQKEVPPDASIATSDWGVLPWALQRTSYQVLNDRSHLLTLERMSRYQTRYLVLLDNGGTLVRATQQMVAELPWIFTELRRVRPRRRAMTGVVYGVDLEAVSRYLRRHSGGGKAGPPTGGRRAPGRKAPGPVP
jgi:hypothetical protein